MAKGLAPERIFSAAKAHLGKPQTQKPLARREGGRNSGEAKGKRRRGREGASGVEANVHRTRVRPLNAGAVRDLKV